MFTFLIDGSDPPPWGVVGLVAIYDDDLLSQEMRMTMLDIVY